MIRERQKGSDTDLPVTPRVVIPEAGEYSVGMSAILEREIKLRFASPEAARAAVLGIGAVPLRSRRLQDDTLLDNETGLLRERRSALRVRIESGRSLVTLKGPAQEGSVMKLREELETPVGDGVLLLRIFEAIGFRVSFRYQKYREEFTCDEVIIAIDETPVGTFVELEGGDGGIVAAAAALGRGPADYVIESYRTLFLQHCELEGVTPADMLFEKD
jgi:adenylate cyclase class 2